MKVDLKKVFPLESDKSDAWNQLRDVEKVASCMPGAEITERVADAVSYTHLTLPTNREV